MKLILRLLLLSSFCWPWLAQGLGIRIADQDPLATARGNAFVATADNPSAIYYNPAGITQLEGQNVRAGFYAITLHSAYTAKLTGTESDTKDEVQVAPQVFFVCSPKEQPLSYGLGFYSPYGLGLEWPDNAGLRTFATKAHITYLTLNPIVAWEIAPRLSLAAGPTLNYAEADLRQGVFPTPLGAGDKLKFKGDDTDVGFNLGLLWQPRAQHAFGVSYRSQTTQNFRGQTEGQGPIPAFLTGTSSASIRFPFPQHVVAGWSFRPNPAWNFEFDVDWTDWDRLDSITVQRSAGNLPAQAFNWRSSFFYEWGLTRYCDKGYALSAGYIYSENSVPDANFNPIVPDSDRHVFSVGVGRKGRQFHWDAAYQLAYGPSRTVNNSAPSTAGELADGRYRFISHALTFSLGYTF